MRLLGEDQITHVAADDYHRYDRAQRAERGVTPLHPDCNHLDILGQHLRHLRAREPILKPVYRHRDGTFQPPRYVRAGQFTIVEGLLGFHTGALRDVYDVRVFLAPPEDMRRRWKVQRDCSRRGYTTDEVLHELERRENDAETYIRPQQRHADIVISFMPGDRGDQDRLDAHVTMRASLVHPDLAPFVDRNGITLAARGSEKHLWISGTLGAERGAAIEEAVWDQMQFASHLRTERLGEFSIGTELHRSETLAIVQVLVLYHLVTARAAVALGGNGTRADREAVRP